MSRGPVRGSLGRLEWGCCRQWGWARWAHHLLSRLTGRGADPLPGAWRPCLVGKEAPEEGVEVETENLDV